MVRATIALFAKPNGLSVRLVESLLSSFCFVKILSDEKEFWDKSLSHIPQKGLFKIIDPKKERELAVFEYLILLNHDLVFSEIKTLEICRIAAAQSAKILVALPFVTETANSWEAREGIRGAILKRIPEAGIVYVGDVFGPRYFEKKTNFLTQILFSTVFDQKTEDCGEEIFYPLSTESFAKYLGRSVFSFGPYGKEVAIYSEKISFRNLLALLLKITNKDLPLRKTKIERKEVLGVKQEVIQADVKKELKETLVWLTQNLSSVPFNNTSALAGISKPKAYFLKKGIYLGMTILLFLPFLLMSIGGASLILSFKNPRVLGFSSVINKDAESFFLVYSQIPFLKLIYKPFVPTSRVLALSSEVGVEAVRFLEDGKTLTTSILGDNVYEPSAITKKIALEMGEIYNKTGILWGEIENLTGLSRWVVSGLISENEIETFREKILYGKTLVEKLPEILGKDTPKNYLVLFQNNMELRPTGGFIGSFGLTSFDGGRLTDLNVFDVYSADGQLKGHVEPPGPIRKYLGEANWFLRDSNWDPDFPTSARRAEWFLDKEIDKKVDGVIALDLEVAKGILLSTGPILLPDFNQVFDYKNLYESLQAEVESEFFPGSQKKASIMTALIREIMNRLSNLKGDKYLSVAKEIAKNLEEKHIQVYFNGQDVQSVISSLGYSGEVSAPTCSGSCTADWYSVVDANVGVTKANYFIKRSYNLDVTISGNTAKKTLEVIYENTANAALGQTGRYKTYTRILTPETSNIGKVKIENAGALVETDPETQSVENRKEAGIAIEVSPGQTKKLTFTWETPLRREGEGKMEYRFYIRKQAGTLKDPISIGILTKDDSYSYNTNLARDFFARLFFP